MKRKGIIFFTFIVSFVASTLLFLPYKNIYSHLIYEQLKNIKDISYTIEKASLFKISLKNINYRGYKLDKCIIYLTPIKYITNGELAKIALYRKQVKATIDILKKESYKYLIEGLIPSKFIVNYLPPMWKPFFNKMNGINSVSMTLTIHKNILDIRNLKVSGDFFLSANGYLTKDRFSLIGVIKIGKIKERFSF